MQSIDLFATRIWAEKLNLDNKKLIDFSIMGIGTSVLGYANSVIDNKVKSAIDNGINTTLNCIEEYELAKEILK